MPGTRTPGMDHPHYEYSILDRRPPLRWPNGRTVAIAVVVLLEHVDLNPPLGSARIKLPDGDPWSSDYNLLLTQTREYGHRVGIFRVLDALTERGFRPTVAFDAMTAEGYPFLVSHCQSAGAELIAHGMSVSQPITSAMSEPQERAYLSESLERFASATGEQSRGWYGPEQYESERTPELLDEAGIGYCLDWPNDEQPYFMTTPNRLVALPTAAGLDDAAMIVIRNLPVEQYASTVLEAFDRLARDGATSARSLVLVVRPWILGHAYRIGAFEDVLEAIQRDERSWPASCGEIVTAFRSGSLPL